MGAYHNADEGDAVLLGNENAAERVLLGLLADDFLCEWKDERRRELVHTRLAGPVKQRARAVQDVKNLPRGHFLFRRTGPAVAGDRPGEEPGLELHSEVSIDIPSERPTAPRVGSLGKLDERHQAGLIIRGGLLAEQATFLNQEAITELAHGEAGGLASFERTTARLARTLEATVFQGIHNMPQLAGGMSGIFADGLAKRLTLVTTADYESRPPFPNMDSYATGCWMRVRAEEYGLFHFRPLAATFDQRIYGTIIRRRLASRRSGRTIVGLKCRQLALQRAL